MGNQIGDMDNFGCDNCCYLRLYRCKLWGVKVADPHNSHCESGHNGDYNRKNVMPIVTQQTGSK